MLVKPRFFSIMQIKEQMEDLENTQNEFGKLEDYMSGRVAKNWRDNEFWVELYEILYDTMIYLKGIGWVSKGII